MRGRKAYCLRSSASLAVRLAISPIERRISSLSLGSSHRSAMRLASASSALMFSSPSGPPWGSANQACKMHEHSLVYLICWAFSYCSFDHYPLTWKWHNKRHKRGENIGWRGSVIHCGVAKHYYCVVIYLTCAASSLLAMACVALIRASSLRAALSTLPNNKSKPCEHWPARCMHPGVGPWPLS